MKVAIWYPEDASCPRAIYVIGDDYKMCVEKAEEAVQRGVYTPYSKEKMMQMLHDLEPTVHEVGPGNPLAIIVDMKP